MFKVFYKIIFHFMLRNENVFSNVGCDPYFGYVPFPSSAGAVAGDAKKALLLPLGAASDCQVSYGVTNDSVSAWPQVHARKPDLQCDDM